MGKVKNSRPRPTAYDVRQHGATGDGRVKDTLAIQSAIDRAGENGGLVYFPSGNYLSGTLHLRSGVTLEISEGATLIASRDESDFDIYEQLGYESHADHETTYFRHALLCGEDLQNICLRGRGTIDAQGSGRGGPKPIALKRCRGISVTELTIRNAPNYSLSLLGCDDAEIKGIAIFNGYVDGIDLDCCRHVSVRNCRVQSRNDAICLKTSLALGVNSSTENITVNDCTLTTTRSAFKLGSESSGDFKNVLFTNCTVLYSPEIFEERPEAGISLQVIDGGQIEGVVVSNISLTGVCVPVFIRLGNRGRGQAEENRLPGKLGDVLISRIVATRADLAGVIAGIPGEYVADISLKNMCVSLLGGGNSADAAREVEELIDGYPRPGMFGVLPAYGLFIRHARDLKLDGVNLRLETPDERPAVVIDDVENIDLRNMFVESAGGSDPVVWFKNVRNGLLEDSCVERDAKAYLRIDDERTTQARAHASKPSESF